MKHPLFATRLERPAIVGEFKRAGSTDPDILQAVRAQLLADSKEWIKNNKLMKICAVLIGIFIITIPASILLYLMASSQTKKAQGNIALVDEVLKEIAGRAP